MKVSSPLGKVVLLLFALTATFGGFYRVNNDRIEVIEDVNFLVSARDVATLQVSFGAEDFELKVYGLQEALEVAAERDSDSKIIVRIATAAGHIRTRSFPFRTHQVELDYSNYDNSAIRLDVFVSNTSRALGVPLVYLAPPGTYGSDGSYGQSFEASGVELIDQALDQIASLFPERQIVLAGSSASGLLVSGVLSKRTDLSCVILASTPLDTAAHLQYNEAHRAYLRSLELRNPTAEVDQVVHDPAREIFIGYSRRDLIVSPQSQVRYAELLRSAGHSVSLEAAIPIDQRGHDISVWMWQEILRCAGRIQ